MHRIILGWAAAALPFLAQSAAPTPTYSYVHHPVSTEVAAAQSAFDRGLTLVFAYQFDEAEQAFRQAARLDPSLAMAWWGIALSLGPYINEQPTAEKSALAAEAVSRATLLLTAGTATESEHDYIDALSVRYSSAPSPDFDRLAASYRDAMRGLVAKYPQDADARALFAEAIMDLHPWRLWHSSGKPEDGTEELVENIEQGLAAQPGHLGLLHSYIHAVEASPHPERALEAARTLSALPMEPAAAHLVHMPAHIYMRVGDWQAAVQSNEHASHHALDYRLSRDPKARRACGHCADFLSYAYMMQGSESHALQAAQDYQKLTDDPSNTLAVLIRFSKWDELLALSDPGETSKADSVHDAHELRGLWHFGRGMALVARRRIAQAQDELKALDAQAAAAPGPADFTGPPDVQHVLDKISRSADAYNLRIASALLGSRIAEAQRDYARSIDLMRSAVKLQDDMPYGEPPPWFYPVRESLGGLLLRRGSARDAEQVFRETLQRSPQDPRALLGLSAALRAQGAATAAAQAKSRFESGWRFSDVKVSATDF